MTDTRRLKEVIEANGLKTSFLAEKLGISRQALLNKMSNKTEFKAGETLVLRELLNLTPEQWESLFFTKNVE